MGEGVNASRRGSLRLAARFKVQWFKSSTSLIRNPVQAVQNVQVVRHAHHERNLNRCAPFKTLKRGRAVPFVPIVSVVPANGGSSFNGKSSTVGIEDKERFQTFQWFHRLRGSSRSTEERSFNGSMVQKFNVGLIRSRFAAESEAIRSQGTFLWDQSVIEPMT